MVADDERLSVDQVEARPDPADGEIESTRLADRGLGEDLAEPLDLGRVMAGDQDLVAARSRVESGFDLVQLAGEPLDRLDPEVTSRLERVGRERGNGDRRLLDQLGERRFDREQALLVVDPAEVVAGFLAEVVGLDEGDPGPFGESVGGMAEGGGVVAVEARRDGQVDRFELAERALSLGIERADRLDVIAEELDSDRVGGVGREDVEDAPSEAEFAGNLDHLDSQHPLLDQPGRQPLHRDRVADLQSLRGPRQHFHRRYRLQERLHRSDDEPWRRPRS